MSKAKRGEGTVILGAGLAGLSAAYHAGSQAVVYEASGRPGGECVTDRIGGYHFDRAGHLLHLRTSAMRSFVNRLLPGRFRSITRDARIHLMDSEVRYPIQANTYGLPAAVKADALRHYLEAAVAKKTKPKNFTQWARATFGLTLSQLFFEPYNRKLWTVDPSCLTLEWMGAYVPRPELARVIRGAFADISSGGGYNATFWYPRKGGIDCLAQALAKRIPRLYLQAQVLRIDPRRRRADVAGQGQISWKQLISTLPLPVLITLLTAPPQRVIAAARQLQWTSVLVVNLGIRRRKIHNAHWIYFPEMKYSFYRVGFPGNFGKVSPLGSSSLYAEVALAAGTGWEHRHTIARQVRRDLMRAGILKDQDKIVVEHFQYIPYAYVIFDKHYALARKTILAYLEQVGIQSIGRWGHWEYSAMEDALLAGKEVVNMVKGV